MQRIAVRIGGRHICRSGTAATFFVDGNRHILNHRLFIDILHLDSDRCRILESAGIRNFDQNRIRILRFVIKRTVQGEFAALGIYRKSRGLVQQFIGERTKRRSGNIWI